MECRKLVFVSLAFMCGCADQEVEKARLQEQLVFVRSELESSRKDVETLMRLGVLMDSIDRNRYDVLVDWREEDTPPSKYKYRLRAINHYVAETELRINYLEKELKNVTGPSPDGARMVHRLRERILERSREIHNLKVQLASHVFEGEQLSQRANEHESEFERHEIRMREQERELYALVDRIDSARKAYQEFQAESYFHQANVLLEIAERTHFAAGKKRGTLEEALALYRHALELGIEEARVKVLEIEEQLK